MPQRNFYYLAIWGKATHAVRTGEGRDEAAAALCAFGHYDAKLMTLRETPLKELQSDAYRTLRIFELLATHIERLNKHLNEDELDVEYLSEAIERSTKLRAELKRNWESRWKRLGVRKLSIVAKRSP